MKAADVMDFNKIVILTHSSVWDRVPSNGSTHRGRSKEHRDARCDWDHDGCRGSATLATALGRQLHVKCW